MTPTAETCATPIDDDCDNAVNEEGADCACTPGSTAACYSGPAGTADVGACKSGVQICNPSGTGYGACTGDIVPLAETCATPVDDDCDGEVNEDGDGCVCVPNASESCYSGPTGTAGTGACQAGTRTCNALGTEWGACTGEVLPTLEQCSTLVDDDCDGSVNEDGADCVCTPGASKGCYSGPSGTLGVGLCAAGTQLCNSLGTGYLGCQGDVTPTAESCATYLDEDCDAVAECPGDALSGAAYSGALQNPILVKPGDALGPDALVNVNGATGVEPRWLRFDDAGTLVQQIGFPATAKPTAFALDSCYGLPGDVVAGTYSGSPDFGDGPLPAASYGLFLFRKGFSGSWSWAKGFPATSGSLSGLQITCDTPVVDPIYFLAGFTSAVANLGAGPIAPGPFMAGFDVQGAIQWSLPLKVGGSGSIHAIDDIKGLLGEHIGATGTFSGSVDFGTGPIQGGVRDIFIALVKSPNGTLHEVKRYGGPGQETVLVHRGNDGFALAGTTDGGVDFGGGALPAGMFVALLYNNTQHRWSKSFPGCTPLAIGSASDASDILVAADCAQSIDLGGGPLPAGRFVAQFDGKSQPLGQLEWSRPMPATPSPVQLVLANHPFVTGWAPASVDFGTGVQVSGPSFFVTRLLP